MPRFVFSWDIVLLSLSRLAQGLFAWNRFINPVTDILVEMVGDSVNFRKAAILVPVVNECTSSVYLMLQLTHDEVFTF